MIVACEAHLLAGEIDQAIATCEKASARTNDLFAVQTTLAAAYANRGDMAKAAAAKPKCCATRPDSRSHSPSSSMGMTPNT